MTHLWHRLVPACGVLLLITCAGVYSLRTEPVSLRCGYVDFKPYAAADENGRPTGVAVEILTEAARRAGVNLRWVYRVDPESAMRRGEIDLFPLMTVTSARLQEFHMSEPWWEYTQLLVSRRDRPLPTAGSTAGKRIAVRDQPAIVDAAHSAMPGAFLKPTMKVPELLGQICGGALDGGLVEGRLLHSALLSQPSVCAGREFEAVPLPQTLVQMGSISTRAAAGIADRIFKEIQVMVAEGAVTESANRWFFMPQQRFVRQRLLERERLYLIAFYAAGVIVLLVSLRFWISARKLRRAADSALNLAQNSERRFETFMAHSPAVTMLLGGDGRIIYVNHSFERVFGIRADQAVGMSPRQIWPEPLAARMAAHDPRVIETGTTSQEILEAPDAAGVLRQWLMLRFRVDVHEGPPLVGVKAVDITEEQRAAERIRESEGRFRHLFEQSPLAMHEIDGEGIVRRTNRAECELLGLQPEEILGRHASEFAAPEERDESRSSVALKLAGIKRLKPYERSYVRKDGRVLRMEVHESAILTPGGAIQGIRSCLVDLTGRYEAQQRLDEFAVQLQEKNAALALALEAAQEATRLKSQFLANMSHEIRTPMNGVLGLTELLMASGLNDQQFSLAKAANESGEHLLEIINDILDFSKIEAGKMVLERLSFDLRGLVESAAGLMAPGGHAKGLEVICHVEPEVPRRLLGDPARLRQVLLNLLGNAIKFTSEGHIALLVSGRRREDASKALIGFSVVDTGVGIPKEAQPALFNAFTQADSSTTRRFGGTGLGLAIGRRIVDQMGGEMGVNSREGKGSAFWFNLEFDCDTDAPPEAPAPELRGMRLLVLDDHPLSRSVIVRHAESWGMRATAPADGETALKILHEAAADNHPFQLAAVDAAMPGMSGEEFCRAAAADPSLAGIGIVLMTPIGTPAPVGFGKAISKPVRPSDLLRALESIVAAGSEPVLTRPVPARPAASPSRGRILIAEDNPVNQRVASLQVRSLGFTVDLASNGEEALEALERSSYDLVLMDCQMPHMDGFAATRELRRREGPGVHMPVIALTANAFASDREACLLAGMDDFLSKPVNLKNLAAAIERWSASPVRADVA